MKFSAHGSFSVEIQGRVLIVDGTGPFNEEIVSLYSQAINDAIKSLIGEPWDQISILHGMSIFTPEAQRDLIENIKKRKALGLQRSAVIVADVEGTSTIITQLSQCYEDANVGYAFFNSLEDARKWLSEEYSATV